LTVFPVGLVATAPPLILKRLNYYATEARAGQLTATRSGPKAANQPRKKPRLKAMRLFRNVYILYIDMPFDK
jgi:hypothetical protein